MCPKKGGAAKRRGISRRCANEDRGIWGIRTLQRSLGVPTRLSTTGEGQHLTRHFQGDENWWVPA